MNPRRKFCPNDRGRKETAAENKQRTIMHIDMDAFFAAIEEAHLPRLKGKSVIIGGPPEGRGVVTTCSYEARRYGVHSAMSSAQAIKLCPEGIFIHNSLNKYGYVSMEIMKILSEFSPRVEPFSVDEAFLDITNTADRYGGPAKLAHEVKRKIWESQKLTASIGIASIRFVAKMASGASKPDGLTIIEPGKEKEFLWHQPIGNLWGVGPKSEKAFRTIGINTIGDLAKYPKNRLKKYFGIVGESLRDMANGIGDDEIRSTHEESDDKSMGHEHTFDRDERDPDKIFGMLLYLCEKVSRRLRAGGYKGRTITLKVKLADRKLLTRAGTINNLTDCETIIFRKAKYLFEQNKFMDKPIRLIGVSVSKLEKNPVSNQQDLLSNPNSKLNLIDSVIDQLKDRYGEHSITHAGTRLKY
jgi:DNA polymerase-4